jgi:uridine kinase
MPYSYPVSQPAQLTFPVPPLVLGIAGCSGSGKTTLAREIACELNATLLPLDLYYRDLAHLPAKERALQNFDHPDSLEHELLLAHVRELAQGRSVRAPVYDFATHTRVPGRTEPVAAASVLIVEGILALHYAELLPLYAVGVFVDASHEVCLTRRIHRDVNERGRTEQSVRDQYWATAHPMAERFVLPSAANASLTVDGCSSLDWSVEQILGTLRRRKLLPRS